MRLSRLLVPVALAACGGWARSQTPPAFPTAPADLPSTAKPKAAAQTATPPAAPAAVPAANQPDSVPETDPKASSNPKVPEDPNMAVGNKAVARDLPDTPAGASATDASAGPDYTGPSILSRGVNFTRPSLPQNERFRPFAGVNFYRDSGVSGPYQGPDGKVTDSNYSGVDLNFGISGQHYRKADAFQLDYRGHYYSGNVSSQDHVLALGYSRILSRRMTVYVSESAGVYSNNYAILNSVATTDTSVGNTALIVTPNTESFDDRTYYSSTQGDLTFQKNARLSFNVGVSGFLVKRNGSNLISANGYQARSDVAYRLSKRSTLGPYYAYSRYLYSGTFGDSGIHTVGLNYSYAFNKRSSFRFRFGGTRLETRGLENVLLSPEVAAILGFSTGLQRYYTVSYVPDFAADINRSFRRGDVVLSYSKGVSPGNGVILTSRHDSVSITYSYTGFRSYAASIGFGRDSLGSVSQQLGNYTGYYGRLNVSRKLPYNVTAQMTFDYRKLGYGGGNTYARDQYRISLGFAYSPIAGPLKFW